MPFPIEDKLVVAVASSALFDLSESHAVFVERGKDAYRRYQREREDSPLAPGVALPFVRRILALNRIEEAGEPVEVVLISRNDPDTGSRVFRSIEHHDLGITRAAFTGGRDPWPYLPAFHAALFLSADPDDVRAALVHGHAAGQVLRSEVEDDRDDHELRIAFDFDGVLADDEAERFFRDRGLEAFNAREQARGDVPLHPGPLKRLFEELGRLQDLDRARAGESAALRIAIVTARDAPARQRVVTTLRAWGLTVDETFFLGGMDKRRVLEIYRPHLFFDDQLVHAQPASRAVPAVHVPFGVRNA
jgi:5'-nucleotidase